jgi:SAM-dependent methyltransferase
MSQKDVFLESEANAWFKRNRDATAIVDFKQTLIVQTIEDVIAQTLGNQPCSILEIGCSDAGRLAYLAQNPMVKTFGLEPSGEAVKAACARGIDVVQGTADIIPHVDKSIDIVVFGFCLYLCDREDLFKIAQEAHRVLKDDAWVIIQDFYSEVLSKREYHHLTGLFSYKMDYRKIFDWHPDYTCYSHRISNHGNKDFTDRKDDWVAISVLRKSKPR